MQSQVAAGFSQFSKNIPKPFLMYTYILYMVLCNYDIVTTGMWIWITVSVEQSGGDAEGEAEEEGEGGKKGGREDGRMGGREGGWERGREGGDIMAIRGAKVGEHRVRRCACVQLTL